MMFLDTVIFMIMSIFYTYKPISIDYEEISMCNHIDLNFDTIKLLGSYSGEEIPLQIKTGEQTELEAGIKKKNRNKNP